MDELKVGQVVVVRHSGDELYTFHIVERLTAKSVLLDDGERYNRRGGKRWGWSDSLHAPRIAFDMTREEAERVNKEKAANKRRNMLTKLIADGVYRRRGYVTVETLEQVVALLGLQEENGDAAPHD